MAINADQDYVFIPKVDVIENNIGKMIEGCLVATPSKLFVVPVRGLTNVFNPLWTTVNKWSLEGKGPREAIAELVADTEMTVDKLEEFLSEGLAGDKDQREFDLDTVERFQVGTSFWKKTFVKSPGGKLKRINIRGKAGKLQLNSFYAARLG